MQQKGSLEIVPLGGLGEIGMNCLALVAGGETLIVDCGTAFPEDDIGIDVIHPDFSWLLTAAPKPVRLFLTHGHEDHIGAVSFLLEAFAKLGVEMPLWGPRHALALVEHRLKERGVSRAHMTEVVPGKAYTLGHFVVEPVRVAHSIVEATALCIQAAGQTVVHSGDFKFDDAPPDGEPTDEARLEAIGDEGVDLLFSDSTNIDKHTPSGNESSAIAHVEKLVAQASGRVVVALFASNVQRLIGLGEVALRTGRKLCLLGRSVSLHAEVATRIGRLAWPTGLLIAAERAQEQPPEKLLVLASGTQGEPGSSVLRLANGTHQHLKLEAGDTAIFSSRVIPGNDRKVLRVMNAFLRRGLRVHSHFSDPGVHVSGHASRVEQERLLTAIRPRSFMPVHGTLHHLTRHADLARSLGVDNICVVENGQTTVLDSSGLKLGPRVQSGRVSIAYGGEVLAPEVQNERAELGRSGLALFSLVLSASGKLAAQPELSLRGVPLPNASPGRLAAIARDLGEIAEDQLKGWRKNRLDVRLELTRLVRRYLERQTGTRLGVEVHLLELG